MSSQINLLQMASALGKYAYARQNLISQNIANSDTPGYKARDFHDFTEAAQRAFGSGSNLRQTRANHIGYNDRYAELTVELKSAFGSDSPNGNTVAIEDQMVRSAEVQQQHQLALGVYSKSLSIMRAALGRQ